MNPWNTSIRSFLVVAVLAASVPGAAAAASLEPFAGAWKGSGTARAKPSATPETARCRIAATLSNNGRTLKQSGQCAVPGHKVDVGGTLNYDEATQRITGSWRDVATGRAGSLSGRFDGAVMRRSVVVANPGEGEPASYALTFTLAPGGYRLVTQAPGEASPLADLRFTK